MANPLASGIVPAQLGFLAIYNPSLGATDETVDNQIVYYASASTQSTSRRRRHRSAKDKDGRPTDKVSNEERNERLRQIGLAQGMVEFGRSFSGGKPVDSIDTERSRVVLHELEPGWWILASIDFTRLPLPPTKTAGSTSPPPPAPPKSTSTSPNQPQQYEYSSREVKPPILLLQDLLRAHALFLLHHSPSLTSLFTSLPRADFTALLARYWDLFVSTWYVLLHGNPACAVLGGIKMAACGELGIGVGEEERGSGEREVLEGLVGGVEGLVDLVVGRFGERREEATKTTKGKGEEGWLGRGSEVGAEDGVVFLGVGALSRRSLRDVVNWMEDIYTWGESAYGVVDSSAGGSRSRRRRGAGKKAGTGPASPTEEAKKDQATGKSTTTEPQASSDERHKDTKDTAPDVTPEGAAAAGAMDKMFSYLKLGYGTYWSLGSSSPATTSDADDEPRPAEAAEGAESQKPLKDLDAGYFLIRLDKPDTNSAQPDSSEQKNPTRPRTVTVELESQDSQTKGPNAMPKTATLRPVVYVHQPFIYILLFQSNTASSPRQSLSQPLSQTLLTQLTPLYKPLLTHTAYRPEKPILTTTTTAATSSPSRSSSSSDSAIYDLVFDTSTLTIHSTIPNTPDPVLLQQADSSTGMGASAATVWTRAEALNTHNQILSMYAATREDLSAREKTCKTSRGWWVVWNRVIDPSPTLEKDKVPSSSVSLEGSDAGGGTVVGHDDDGESDKGSGSSLAAGKEIFLVRRASDHGGAGVGGMSASYVGGGAAAAAAGGWADGASRLAQGIGVDTRRYIEGLLSLNR